MEKVIGESALDAHLMETYGRPADGGWKSILNLEKRGLDHIAWYRQEGENPHWLFVTYGFSELDEKVTDDPMVSGCGYELTFRLARMDETEPHEWVHRMLGDYADYVFTTWKAFTPYDYMEYTMDTPEPSTFTGALFVPDAELKEIDTPNGKVQFFQILPILKDELSIVQDANTKVKDGISTLQEYTKKVVEIEKKLSRGGTHAPVTDIHRV